VIRKEFWEISQLYKIFVFEKTEGQSMALDRDWRKIRFEKEKNKVLF